MTDDELDGGDPRTATGLLAIGGILIALLFLGGIVGTGFLFFARARHEAMLMEEIAVAEVAVPPPAVAVERPADDPARLKRAEERFVGVWTATSSDGSVETWDIRDDKSMTKSIVRKDKTETTKGTWELLIKVNAVGEIVVFSSDNGKSVQQGIRFEDEKGFVEVPFVEAEVDGSPVIVPDHHRKFSRKPANP